MPLTPSLKDRHFTLMTLVMAAMAFAILGLYLPLTIYMQSVLGLSAIDAGLVIALQPLAMIVSWGIASSLPQKVAVLVLAACTSPFVRGRKTAALTVHEEQAAVA